MSSTDSATIPTRDEVAAAAGKIREKLSATPLLTSSSLDSLLGCRVFFKADHLQKTGSFKSRGALLNVIRAKESGATSVVTHSSGNHGQAMAWAAAAEGLAAIVVVPENAPTAKTAAISGYGASIVRCANSIQAREEECAKQAASSGGAVVEPYASRTTIMGQGSVGIELAEQAPALDAVFIATGGGGLASGIAIAMPEVPLFLVEPMGKELQKQLDGTHDGCRDALPTIADGIRVRQLGQQNLAVLRQHQQIHVVTVSDEEIREALILIWTRLKQHVEPTAAVALAGLRQVMAARPHPDLQSVAVVLCGGNVDHSFIP